MRTIVSLFLCLVSSMTLVGGFATKAAAKQDPAPVTLKPAPGKALVYLIREHLSTHTSAPEPVLIDDISWGTLRPMAYLVCQIDPGTHEVTVGGSRPYKINLTAGKTHYYLLEYHTVRADIQKVSEGRGKKWIERHKPSPDNKLAHTLVAEALDAPPTAAPKQEPASVELSPAAGKALVYVVREHEGTGGNEPEPVSIDKVSWGSLRRGYYLVAQLEPGRHALDVRGSRSLEMSLVSGKTYYYAFHDSPWLHIFIFRELTKADGKKRIARARICPDNKLAHTLVAGTQRSSVAIQPKAPSLAPLETSAEVVQPTAPSPPPQEKPSAVIHSTAAAPPAAPSVTIQPTAPSPPPQETSVALIPPTTLSVPQEAPPAVTKPTATVPSAASSETARSFDFGSYQALIIGNNKYEVLPDLRTASNDARSMAKLLEEKYGFKTELIFDATRADILRAISQYRRKLTGRDNLLIYYAGHGWLDEDADEGYWLPVDAGEQDPTNWVSNSSITTALRAMQAKHILVVADSCYSGKLARGINIRLRTSGYYEKICRKKARTVMASGGIEPVSDRGSKGEHSVFASALIEALSENEGVLDATLLFSKIRRPVMLNADQTPEYSDIRKAGHDGGDFLFVPVSIRH